MKPFKWMSQVGTAGNSRIGDAALWAVRCEGVWGDGGGVMTLHVLTDSPVMLPDARAAWESLISHGDGSVYLVHDASLVGLTADYFARLGPGAAVHDQRTGRVATAADLGLV